MDHSCLVTFLSLISKPLYSLGSLTILVVPSVFLSRAALQAITQPVSVSNPGVSLPIPIPTPSYGQADRHRGSRAAELPCADPHSPHVHTTLTCTHACSSSCLPLCAPLTRVPAHRLRSCPRGPCAVLLPGSPLSTLFNLILIQSSESQCICQPLWDTSLHFPNLSEAALPGTASSLATRLQPPGSLGICCTVRSGRARKTSADFPAASTYPTHKKCSRMCGLSKSRNRDW